MRVVITGATGFIGTHLVRALSSLHEVICLVRDLDHPVPGCGVRLVHGDLRSVEHLAGLPSRVDAIIHLAQATGSFPDDAGPLFEVNARSTLWLADYARRAEAARFILASTGSVYRRARNPIPEDGPLAMDSFYAVSKKISEDILGFYATSFGTTILRLFAPYGHGQQNRLIPNLIRAVLDRRPIQVVNGGEPRMNPVYVEDVTKIIEQALTSTGNHIANVAGPDIVSIVDIANAAATLAGCVPHFIEGSGPEGDLVADTTRMGELFPSIRLTPFQTGLEKTMAAVA